MNNWLKVLLLAAALLVGHGCAGYRSGWESAAYVGDTPPLVAEDAHRLERAPTIRLPGLELQVTLNNRLQTSDKHVYAVAVPVMADDREVYVLESYTQGKTRVGVEVTPLEAGFVFLPTRAVLQVDGRQHVAVSGAEFAQWGPDGGRVEQGGVWDERPLGAELALAEPGRRYLLSIYFDAPIPSPVSADISVDLGRALVSKQRSPLPLVRFAPVRWREGYT